MSKLSKYTVVLLVTAAVLIIMFSGLACDVKSPQNISVTPEVFEMEHVGDTVQYQATGVYPDGKTEGLTAEVNWTSSDTAVVNISKGGLATAVGTGQVNLTAILDSSSGVIRSRPVGLTVLNDAPDVTSGSVITPIPEDHPTSNCGLCHSIAIQGTTQWPSGHGAYSDESCTLCHHVSTQPDTIEEPSITTDPPADIPKEHPITNCAFCHDSGNGNTPMWAAGHGALPDDSCKLCHSISTEASDYSVTPNPPTLRPLEHPENSCSFCHASGLAGSSPWPSGHYSFSEEACTQCHQISTIPSAGGVTPEPPPLIPYYHPDDDCAFCHESGLASTPSWPIGHDIFTDTTCGLCHGKSTEPSSESNASPIPANHMTGGCSSCHSISHPTGAPLWPTDHSELTPDIECSLCHMPL